ncbi:MAG: pseudouridine-5'-phosphate glycosidase [Blastocatellia bacterium]|nr:pseudouridine-5'-phosphate glycosidase [Blastocatellia bacterium]
MRGIRIANGVANALFERRPIVALESTVIAHGLPKPLNIETARACEQAVIAEGAVPATVGIVDGAAVIGLSEEEIEVFADASVPGGGSIEKVNPSNLAAVMVRCAWGATTVAATMGIAFEGGLRVFSTGGIGGVHRGANESFDISADLTALANMPMVCVCAGAKAILDLPKTRELLETLGIPVVGYGTEEFPAFYSRASGLEVDISVATADEAAEVAALHWQSGGRTAVLVCAPVPAQFELSANEVERAIRQAIEEAKRSEVRGKALTPFLLSQMERLTGGSTLEANRALLVNNAGVAARIAKSLKRFM